MKERAPVATKKGRLSFIGSKLGKSLAIAARLFLICKSTLYNSILLLCFTENHNYLSKMAQKSYEKVMDDRNKDLDRMC